MTKRATGWLGGLLFGAVGCTSTFTIPFEEVDELARNQPIRVEGDREIRFQEAIAVGPHIDTGPPGVTVQVNRDGAWEWSEGPARVVPVALIRLQDGGALISGRRNQVWLDSTALGYGLDVVVPSKGAREGKIAGAVIGSVLGACVLATIIGVAVAFGSSDGLTIRL